MTKLFTDKRGSTLTEYAVILGLIALIAWGAIGALGVDVANVFNFIGDGKTSTTAAGTNLSTVTVASKAT